MRLLYLTHRVPYPPNKGEKIRTYHQIKHLLNINNIVFVCCPVGDQSESDNLNNLCVKFSISSIHAKLGNKFFRLLTGLLRNKPLSVANFYSSKLQRILDALLSDTQFEAIICTSSSMAEYIFRSKVLNKRRAGQPKLVMDFMDLDSDKWIQYAKSSKSILKIVYQREAKLLEKYEARIVKHFNDCFLISHAEVEAFEISICKSNKLHVMGNGIDLDVFYPNANKSFDPVGPVLLFTGVMDYKPNIDAVSWLAGKVWFRLLELYPNIRLIISGMNPTPAVRKLSEIQGIEVTGFVEDILPYYHKSDIFVAPLQIARGVQNKILQAMASGLPVISSSMGAEGINCESGTHILIADTPDQFIQHLNALVNEPEFRNSLISHARKLVEEQYSWASNLAILENVLKKR